MYIFIKDFDPQYTKICDIKLGNNGLYYSFRPLF